MGSNKTKSTFYEGVGNTSQHTLNNHNKFAEDFADAFNNFNNKRIVKRNIRKTWSFLYFAGKDGLEQFKNIITKMIAMVDHKLYNYNTALNIINSTNNTNDCNRISLPDGTYKAKMEVSGL